MRSSPSSSTPPDGGGAAPGADRAADLDRADAYDYELPAELVAATPVGSRDESRLLVLRGSEPPAHRRFSELPALLDAGDVLVRNTARVLAARLEGRKPTGGRVELLVLRRLDADWHAPGPSRLLAIGRASKPIRPGLLIALDSGAEVAVAERRDEGQLELLVDSPLSASTWLDEHGLMPLPPYIRRARDERGLAVTGDLDRRRYQTVYAGQLGAVAAPTAGLHFTAAIFERLRERGVDVVDVHLDVGIGTFKPVEAERVDEHEMHAERYVVTQAAAATINRARAAGRRLIALGTTAFRVLEDQARRGHEARPGAFETRLFVRPGSAIRWVGGLITNFHLPRSTLLMLVSAVGGHHRVMTAYAEAVRERYRFYSYGDAMLVLP